VRYEGVRELEGQDLENEALYPYFGMMAKLRLLLCWVVVKVVGNGEIIEL